MMTEKRNGDVEESAERELDSPSPPRQIQIQDKLRGLSVAEQHKVARSGNMAERVALERIYGPTVWEMLLRNPQISIPEVARIARMGALPRPLLELIVANPTWIQAPPVRRALLSNPRLSGEQVNKILRVTPRNELRLMPQQTAYPAAVRSAARRFLN